MDYWIFNPPGVEPDGALCVQPRSQCLLRTPGQVRARCVSNLMPLTQCDSSDGQSTLPRIAVVAEKDKEIIDVGKTVTIKIARVPFGNTAKRSGQV